MLESRRPKGPRALAAALLHCGGGDDNSAVGAVGVGQADSAPDYTVRTHSSEARKQTVRYSA